MSEYCGIHITYDPKIFGGRPNVGAHRVSIHDRVALHQRGETPERVAAAFGLTTLEVRAALAYFDNHREEIDRELVEDELAIARLASQEVFPLSEQLRKVGKDRKLRSLRG